MLTHSIILRHKLIVGCYSAQDDVRQFYKRLLSFVPHRSQKLEIFALTILTSLCLHDDIGQQVPPECVYILHIL